MALEAQVSPLDLTRDLRDLARLAAGGPGIDDLLRRGLDWLARFAPYDLATVFLVDGDTLRVKAARGLLANEEVRNHSISLEKFPTVREAIESRRARAFTEDDHSHGDGDPFDGVLDLPHGHSCMVVPLSAADRGFGLLTLDRTRCEMYPQAVVDLVEVYAQMLALAIHNAEQREVLDRLRSQDEEQMHRLEAELIGGSEAVLESSRSEVVRALAWKARQVATTQTPVLLLGETGTGKERLAHALHLWSHRNDRPFVSINCAAIPVGLLESELFGHVKGAFTGATRDRPGRFQIANGGTLLLDEVGELPFDLQAKLLRVLQEGTFEAVGSDRTIKDDVRVIAATHVDLESSIGQRRFREDLYYRLSVFPLRLPPLRERLEDLPRLCEVLLADQVHRTGRTGLFVSPAGIEKLSRYTWPGNIRELANVLERAAILSPKKELGPSQFELSIPVTSPTSSPPMMAAPLLTPRSFGGVDAQSNADVKTLDEVQRNHIESVLEHTQGRVYGAGGAAELLGIKPTTLQHRMKKLGVRRSRTDRS
jgi:transcriptional regulator with GAF, ATPase, and Fis domain